MKYYQYYPDGGSSSVKSKNTKYSFDLKNWTTWNGSPINLTKGQKVYFYGENLTYTTSDEDYYYFVMQGKIAASGNIMSLIQFGETMGEECFHMLFGNCSCLTTAPELPATKLVTGCYNNMFQGCTKLNRIKVNTTSWLQMYGWVKNVSSTGTFVKPTGTDIPTGVNGIPAGWTVINE